jgi:hypothetical protein
MQLNISFILETDNFIDSKDELLFASSVESWTRSLADWREAGGECDWELVIVSDQSMSERDIMKPLGGLLKYFPDASVTAISVPGSTYYEKKMAGAQVSKNQWLVFVDSDVTYDINWFEMLAEVMINQQPDAIYGETFAMAGNPTQNSAAMGWQFPFETPGDSRMGNKPHKWNNNWAVSRAALMSLPLPRLPGDLKLEGALWDIFAEREGLRILSCRAKGHHLQPQNRQEMFALGLRRGVNGVILSRLSPRRLWTHLGSALASKHFVSGVARYFTLRREVPDLEFSFQALIKLLFSYQLGQTIGTLSELFSKSPRVSFDYSGLESNVFLELNKR